MKWLWSKTKVAHLADNAGASTVALCGARFWPVGGADSLHPAYGPRPCAKCDERAAARRGE